MKTMLLTVAAIFLFANVSVAGENNTTPRDEALAEAIYQTDAFVESASGDENFLDQFNPNSPDAEAVLEAMEMNEDGAFIDEILEPMVQLVGSCRVRVEINVSIAKQRLSLYIDGRHDGTWKISSAGGGYSTRRGSFNPVKGRIYNKYTSSKYPGGDWKGLGNMPYAIFYSGGFALHGTTAGNIPKLGRPASHGCIRQHPENARYLNTVVRDAVNRFGYCSVLINVR